MSGHGGHVNVPHHHHGWAQATSVLQISNAMTTFAPLIRRRWREDGSVGVGLLGMVVGVVISVVAWSQR